MTLDLVTKNSDDGVTAEIPSLKGCESWAHDEETAIEKILEMAGFYLNLDPKNFKLDKARSSKNKVIYKLVFNKSI